MKNLGVPVCVREFSNYGEDNFRSNQFWPFIQTDYSKYYGENNKRTIAFATSFFLISFFTNFIQEDRRHNFLIMTQHEVNFQIFIGIFYGMLVLCGSLSQQNNISSNLLLLFAKQSTTRTALIKSFLLS